MSTKIFFLIIILLPYFDNATSELDQFDYENEMESTYEDDYTAFFGSKNGKKEYTEKTGPKVWDRWGKWSECSVTCGIGKMTRWRHCVAGGCEKGEKEAQIKTCTLPAC